VPFKGQEEEAEKREAESPPRQDPSRSRRILSALAETRKVSQSFLDLLVGMEQPKRSVLGYLELVYLFEWLPQWELAKVMQVNKAWFEAATARMLWEKLELAPPSPIPHEELLVRTSSELGSYYISYVAHNLKRVLKLIFA